MPRILKLPPAVVDKIAAGEVIERPAAVVKELGENALDAGATRIEIHVEEGGIRRVRVTDDGCGIEPEDLPLALASHATSKIADVEDLESVASLGFRGEALPSIASVSRCLVRSRTPEREAGAEVRCEGGRLLPVREVGAPVGTTVIVEDLFFNTPVRRKFLRAQATELSHANAAVTRLALGHPEVGFVLRHDDREVFRLLAGQELDGRIGALFGGEVQRDLIEVRAEREQLGARGFVLPIHHSRRDTSGIFTFLNGRFLRDRVLLSAIGRAYKELFPRGRHPLVFLHVFCDPAEVDVNVHPTKTEVRFRRSGDVHSFLAAVVGEAVRSPGAAPALRVGSHGLGTRELVPRPAPAGAPPGAAAPSTPLPFGAGPAPSAPAPLELPAAPPAPSPYDQRRAVQVHNAFLVEETPEGISIIDQHALHERILTERIRSRVHDEGLPAQRLLAPIVVHLSAAEVEACLARVEDFQRFGIELDRFGADQIAVHALPTLLAEKLTDIDAAELVRSLVAEAGAAEAAGGAAEREAGFLDRAIYSLACRAAVKIGDPLSPAEIQAILRMRDELPGGALTCPHGRPTTLRLPFDELERRFERT